MILKLQQSDQSVYISLWLATVTYLEDGVLVGGVVKEFVDVVDGLHEVHSAKGVVVFTGGQAHLGEQNRHLVERLQVEGREEENEGYVYRREVTGEI